MHLENLSPWQHGHAYGAEDHRDGERRTRWVVAITLAMMVGEIVAGRAFGSMALLADGWHMGTHAAALGVAVFAYAYARRHAGDPRYTFGTGKVGALGGFASAVGLAVVALLVLAESAARLASPVTIRFDEAIAVAVLGLLVNLGSAFLLRGADHHGHPHRAHDHDHDHVHDHGRHHGSGANHATGAHAQPHRDHNLRAAYLHVLADALTFRVANVEVEITGDLPQSVGLGSSAAVSVALVRAFASSAQINMRPQGLIEKALELEVAFHGAASGVDHNVAFERKLIRFVKGRRGQPLFLQRRVEAVVWIVEPRGSTRERVAEIALLREADCERSERIFKSIGQLVDRAVEALEQGDLGTVGESMDVNHRLLQELGLSTPGLDRACAKLRSMGALGAKLTGAGGGGAVVALFEDADPIVSALAAEGQRAFVARWEKAQ
jgi:mevalonate kinase